jgi:hypothetical protein
MLLKCINNNHGVFLTVGETYQMIDKGHIAGIPVYYVRLDSGFRDWITQTHFISVEELREEKLNQLGI